VLLSDVTASTDWTLARSAIKHIGVFVDDDEDALLDDYDLYPEEILSDVADNVGFGTKLDELLGPS
jgi:hypothetical protein